MLRLPAIRFQLSETRETWLDELCEAYDAASIALENFRQSNVESERALILEYEMICLEIEDDVLNELLR